MSRLGLLWLVPAVAGLLAGLVAGCSPAQVAEAPPVVTVQTIIENNTVFSSSFSNVFLAAGDLTNDDRPDLVFTTGGPGTSQAQAAVFQQSGDGWNAGRLLDGPSANMAARPIIAPIRNDGQNWLVYSEQDRAGQGRSLRAFRYAGQALVENLDIAQRAGLPGRLAPAAADLDGDGRLEIWYAELAGDPDTPSIHLLRREWDAAGDRFPGGEIADGDGLADNMLRPRPGDFLGDGRPGLVWLSRVGRLELLTYTPGAEGGDYTSQTIYNTLATIIDFHVGEYDGKPGTDIAVVIRDGDLAALQLISGGTLEARELVGDIAEILGVVRLADLNGDGLAEIYLAGRAGGLYGFDAQYGWRMLAAHPGVLWQDGAILEQDGGSRPQVIFVGPASGTTFRVVSLSIAAE